MTTGARKPVVAGFSQLRNELSKGNLVSWMRCMQEVCDYVYIYDHASDDGSVEYYHEFDNAHVIASDVNRHAVEGSDLFGKKLLLEKLLAEHPEVDWIFWMDGDTMLDGRLLKDEGKLFSSLLMEGDKLGAECISLGHYNLWRSDTYYRIDSAFHRLHHFGVNTLWKNNGNLRFDDEGGLHQDQFPHGMVPFDRPSDTPVDSEDFSTLAWRGSINGFEPSLIHRGFATDEQILEKYFFYGSMGQEGWDLFRLVYEDELRVGQLFNDILPEWFVVNDPENPINKKKLGELNDLRMGATGVTPVKQPPLHGPES